MGGLTSCCSAEPAENKETLTTGENETIPRPKPLGPDASSIPRPASQFSDEELATFQKRLETTIEVIVLLADGSRLSCDLKLNYDGKSLIISCDNNVREVSIADLKAVLHGKDQLRRVETKANLVDDPNCVALHMGTGNCIPLRFETVKDKLMFIELMHKLK